MGDNIKHLKHDDAIGRQDVTSGSCIFILQLFLDGLSLVDGSNWNDHACTAQEQHPRCLLPDTAGRACDDGNFAAEIVAFAYIKRRSRLAHREEKVDAGSTHLQVDALPFV